MSINKRVKGKLPSKDFLKKTKAKKCFGNIES